MAREHELDVLYADEEGKLADEILSVPELVVQGRYVFVRGEPKPIAKVPEDLVLDPPINPAEVSVWGRYAPARSWVRRRKFEKPAQIVTDEVLQFARSTHVVKDNLAPAYNSVIPGGFYVVRLTEAGRRDILRAAPIQQVLVEAYGPPTAQYRFLYQMESGEQRRDWVGVWQKPGGRTPQGPLSPRRGPATSR